MRPSRLELERFAEELAAVASGSILDRVWRPTKTSLLLEIRGLSALQQAKRPRLYLDLAHGGPWIAVTPRWPDTPAAPDRETLELRGCLENRKIAAIGIEAERRLVIVLANGLRFVVQLAGRYPQAGVLDPEGAPLCALLPTRAIVDDGSPPLPAGADPLPDSPDWLLAHGELAWERHDATARERRRDDLLVAAKRQLKQTRRRIAGLTETLTRTGERDRLARDAELLAGSLHLVEKNATSVMAMDWSADPPAPVLVALDPALSGSANLERLHTRRKKLERTRDAIGPQLAGAEREATRLEALLAELAATPPEDEARLDALALELGTQPSPSEPGAARASERSQARTRLPYRVFRASDGSEILVGRSARDNDALTFKVARGADLFLHARDVPGSHVILRAQGRHPHHPEALLDAAALAAWHSQLREDTVVDVLWTERKHVRKVKGSPGLVQTASPRNVAVRRDPERIARLYATLGDAGDTDERR